MEDKPKKVNKTENINEYMNKYMKMKYKENPMKTKMYKNSLYTRKKYNISEDTWNKYKDNLHHIFHIKKMVDELPSGVFEMFLMEYKTLNFIEPPENI